MIAAALLPLVCVAAGGAVGSVLRFAAVRLVQHVHPLPFPLGTLLVNVIGSFVIGVLMAKLLQHPSEATQLFLITGVLGGFTTFSAFSWDLLGLLQRGAFAQAALYVLGSVGLSLLAVFLGYKVA